MFVGRIENLNKKKPPHENPILICMQNHFQNILQITARFFGWTIEIVAKLEGYYFILEGFEFQDNFHEWTIIIVELWIKHLRFVQVVLLQTSHKLTTANTTAIVKFVNGIIDKLLWYNFIAYKH